jgi:hypothetical protein
MLAPLQFVYLSWFIVKSSRKVQGITFRKLRVKNLLKVWLSAAVISLLLAACSEDVPSRPTSAPTDDSASIDESSPLVSHAETSQPELEPTYAAQIAEMRNPAVPELPFPDNPDPTQCGIPTRWGDNSQAWLTGFYEGELIQEDVLLYDSHLRLDISARVPHGSEVEILLYQQNPVTDYYLVKVIGAEEPNEGWIPGPFLSFTTPNPLN